MAQSQFSLKWDSHKKNICSGLSSLQQVGDFVDMTLAADGHLVKVHQVIIALSSPYLQELISSVQCQHPVILLNKISFQTLCALLEYIYTGEVLISIENLNELVEAGKELHIKGLEDMNLHDNAEKPSNITDAEETSCNNNLEEMEADDTYIEITNPIDNETETYLLDDNNEQIECISVNDPGNIQTEPDEIIMTDSYIVKNEVLNPPALVNFVNIPPPDKPKTNQNVSVMQYTVSNQGNIQIILNRYMYYLKHVNKNGKRHWRCLNYLNRSRCPAHVITKDDIVLQRIAAHTHPFHDKRILKKVRADAIFSAITEAEQEGLVVRQKCKEGNMKAKSNDEDSE